YLLFAVPYDPACEQEMQRLRDLQAKSPEKVQVIVVFDASLSADELSQYVQKLQLPFRIGVVPEGRLSGWDSEAFQRYGVKSVPMLVVIDEQGIVKEIKPKRD
ncbi:MAG: thioredoxin-like domain-containing protein, partial [Armatimonadetes bacterium]|nr:thioredoxin-like domain-containing protein [Armatimonadota bacterium]